MQLAGFTTAGGLVVPVNAYVWRFTLASGPGGQHVNKVSSKATLEIHLTQVHGPTDALERVRTAFDGVVRVSAASSRSQLANRRACIAAAREQIEAAEAPPRKRKPTKPTKAAVDRRLRAKKHRSDTKRARRPAAD